ncbi:MAG: tetratricopeptide repeat protein [Chloroflexi bacterium]|nr:tetratricopeptide repeat protein [Chloroflexota bacterium]
MNNNSPHVEQDIELSFQERIDILFHEIELAVKWDRPSILFAIYKSDFIRDEVNMLLREKLKGISQIIYSIKTNQFDFISEISQLPDLAQTVLLIDGFSWECGNEGVRVLTEFNKHREYFIDNNIRAIFWLFEEEVSDFAANATECWILRHRVVEFVDLPQQTPEVEQSPESVWQSEENSPAEENISLGSFEEIVNLAERKKANVSHANELLSLGILNWRKGNPKNALKYLQVSADISQFLANQALQAQCQNALALVHAELGNMDGAVSAYKQAINLAPESRFLWNNLGKLLAKNERNEDAINAYMNAIACSPQDFLSWDGIGHIYLKMGLYQNAISAFEKALEIAPHYEFSWAGLGRAYLESGQWNKATEPFCNAVEQNTHLVDAWINLGKCFTQQERDLDAIVVYRKAIEFNPQNDVLWGELGRLYLQKQDYVESISAFQKVVSLNPQCGEAKINLAYALFQIGDYETSAAIYEDSILLIEDHATRTTLLNCLGDTYMHLKEYEKAIAAYEQADQTHDEHTNSEDENAKVFHESQSTDLDNEQKIEHGNPAEERGEKMNEPNQIFDLRTATEWNELGNSHLKAGAYNDAIVAYTKAIELAPDASWPYIQNLAHVHYQKGKVRGKLTVGQVEDPDVWEGEDGTDSASIFSEDAIPTPERGDKAEELGMITPLESYSTDQPLSGNDAVQLYSDISATKCCSEPNAETMLETGEDLSKMLLDESKSNQESPQKGESGMNALSKNSMTPRSYNGTPQNAIDLNELGNSYTRNKQIDEAIEAYKRAIEINPRYGQPYTNLGFVYYHLGNYQVAILLYKKSIELLDTAEDKAISWNRLGDAYRRLRDYGNALAAYQQASEMAPQASPVMARARATLLENTVAG